jgi:hypothetical protein
MRVVKNCPSAARPELPQKLAVRLENKQETITTGVIAAVVLPT